MFETDRILVRPWRIDDAEDAFEMYGDEEVMRFLGGATVETLEAERANLDRLVQNHAESTDGFGNWAIEETDSGRVVGAVILKPLPGHAEIEVGWHLARRAWGKGFATEAARQCILYGFEVLNLNRIVAVVNPENHRSMAVAERLGMTREGMIHVYDHHLALWVTMRPDNSFTRPESTRTSSS